MAFAFARLASRATRYQLSPGADYQSPVVLGNIFRQALFTYEFGDLATRRDIEQFWYNFALGGGLSIFETEANIADFLNSNLFKGHGAGSVSACFGTHGVLPAVEALRSVSTRERVGVIGYLLHSNPTQSIEECVASAITIAGGLGSIDLSLCRLWAVPHFVQAVRSIDVVS